MKLHSKSLLLAAAAVLGSAIGVNAGPSATQDVSFTVAAINEISVSGTPSLTVNSATAGSAPTAVTANATYAITTNESNRKITGAINSAMPSGLTLSATLGAPSGASSAGKQPLGTTAVDLVTGISTLNETGKSITYELEATSAAQPQSGTRTVTLTITAGS